MSTTSSLSNMNSTISNIISRTRRNHALEHATIHVLSEHHHNFSAQGNSTPAGFHLNIYGDLNEESIAAAVDEAYRRMQNGERQLAVHPNCGTVLLTTATMVAVASQLAFVFEQRRQHQEQATILTSLAALPSAVLAGVVALIISRPLGMTLQARYTTDGDLGNLRVVGVSKVAPSPVTRLFKLLLVGGSDRKMTAYRIDTSD
jgi:S-ribosylhomocysteine lyase LuxS involved in autoinducer biosynthesis